MNILHLEDNPRDAELVRDLVETGAPGSAITLVSTREAFLRALHEGGPDLILSDFSLPGFSGLEALQLARQGHRDIPFIFISGTIGEERAIEALRCGATDYVIKDRPKRLVSAVQRALQQATLAREQKAVEEQMLRVQRLENIGMLAAGIAHDFNNVLAPILMGVPLLRMRHPGAGDQKILAGIENSATRGAALVKQILGFAQGISGEPQVIQVHHIIRELFGVMEQTFPKSIRLENQVAGKLWPLKANPTQLHQILLNLFVNARDAMPDGGVLTLRAANVSLDEAGAATLPGARPGAYILLEIIDSGTGIPEGIREKIWEPFYTTKGIDRGTGLGLSTVRNIVASHGGVVTLDSALGHGTTFRILLPALPGLEEAVRAGTAREIPRGNGELIVVVDDEPAIREIAGAALTEHGYKVLAAADGAEALALIAPQNLEVRALVTDLDMPNFNGIALIRVVQSLNPAIRTLVTSGTNVAAGLRASAQQAGRMLEKPFTADALIQAIFELLSEGPA